jgi:Asp-tRNA(Asn)/Glu-tRNA(Gln) amidotransferase A subunit family amidase
MARSVADAWLLYLVLRGTPTAARWPLPAARPIAGLRLGVPRGFFHEVLDDEVRARFAASLAWLRQARAQVVDVTIPDAAGTPPVYLHTSLPEAAAYHAESLAAAPGRYTRNVRLRLEMGRYVLAEDYVRAQTARAVLRREVDAALEACDVLVLPTLPIPAPPVGAASVEVAGTRQPVRAMMLRLTQLFNLTGHPAISLPMGETDGGLPCGLQMVGRIGDTEGLLAVAAACEPRVMA